MKGEKEREQLVALRFESINTCTLSYPTISTSTLAFVTILCDLIMQFYLILSVCLPVLVSLQANENGKQTNSLPYVTLLPFG